MSSRVWTTASLALSWLFAAGCLGVEPPEGRLRCAPASVATDCPTGWFCRADERCWRTPGEGVDAGNDGGPDAETNDASRIDPDAFALDAPGLDAPMPDAPMLDDALAPTDAFAPTDAGTDASVPLDAGCAPGTHDLDGVPGCEYRCTLVSAEDPADDAAVDANCDGADGVVRHPGYIYVTPSGMGAPSIGDSPATAVGLGRAFELATTRASTGTSVTLLLAGGTRGACRSRCPTAP